MPRNWCQFSGSPTTVGVVSFPILRNGRKIKDENFLGGSGTVRKPHLPVPKCFTCISFLNLIPMTWFETEPTSAC